tara:strand:- start:1118 stop:1381 length:264 start_codon:yes stop_codon:yes gene_type:complete
MSRTRAVDDRLPEWLNSKILSAVDFIWQKGTADMKESMSRVRAVNEQLSDYEMNWVMMLLILPKIKKMLMTSDEYKEFIQMRNETRH